MPEGNVKWFDSKKGYGFVEHENKDIFIHYTAFIEDFTLNHNDIISFDIVDGEKGKKAQNISKIII